MNATLAPVKFWIEYGGNSVSPVASLTTLAARNSKSAPPKPSPSRQPSTGWQPPFCIRRSSSVPSSNSWLPTALRSSPIWFIASMVGSSWNRLDSRGLAPIRSPADTTIELRFVCSSAFTCVARYSAPPASVVGPTRPLEPAGGWRFPWKSLRARIWTSTDELSWMIGGCGPPPAAADPKPTPATPRDATATRATEARLILMVTAFHTSFCHQRRVNDVTVPAVANPLSEDITPSKTLP